MEKDDSTILTFCHVALAVIVFYVFKKAFDSIGVTSGWADKYTEWYGVATLALAVALGVGAALWIRLRRDWQEYHLAAIAELRKVKWPSFEDTKKMTMIVVVVVGIFAVIVFAFDFAWSWCLQKMLLS